MDVAIFSLSSLFDDDECCISDGETVENNQKYVEREHKFPGMVLLVREFFFHKLNANLLWPGAFVFSEWLICRREWIECRRIIELGSGTGALAIFLRKYMNVDITTSDYNDPEIEDNIAYNCTANQITPVLPHINHTWGDTFPTMQPDWDLIIANDILLYVNQYSNLIKTISFLLKSFVSTHTGSHCRQGGRKEELPRPVFLMSWRRRIGKNEESVFFDGCCDNGLKVEHLGTRIYSISYPLHPNTTFEWWWGGASLAQMAWGINSCRKGYTGNPKFMPVKAFFIASLFLSSSTCAIFSFLRFSGIDKVEDMMEVGANMKSKLHTSLKGDKK